MADLMEQSIAFAGLMPAAINSYRSIWISDVHLGTRGCKAEALLHFLRQSEAENLFLVGDIVDGWNQGRWWYWSPAQRAVAREIARWRMRGANVVFLPGNHDQFHLDLVQKLIGRTPVATQMIHRTAEGRMMLVMHGHQFDESFNAARWPSLIGSRAYTMALRVNDWYNRERLRHSRRARWLKRRVNSVVRYLTEFDRVAFDRAVFETARRYRVDGVICGHSHQPEQRFLDQIWYVNDGDWVESCTALVENQDGALHLVLWGLKHGRAAQPNPLTEAFAS
ncbi:MAG TPA: UDP-2,3-diacylglucosamine diphosphatase [Candidatus Binataceae bacterium]|nr:UDP-2,3-diacylglucosamine diphosphatase [Candidatus Binataceae bacterium]